MSNILLLTDRPTQAGRLFRDLERLGGCTTLDLLDPEQGRAEPRTAEIDAVVSDVSLAHSGTIAALRFQLDRLKARKVPYLCLLRSDDRRNRVQADALGASRVLRADAGAEAILGCLGEALGTQTPATQAPAALDLSGSVASAGQVLTRLFEAGRSDGTVEPELIASGAAFVENALQQSDVRAWLDVVWRFDDATHQHCLLVAGLAAGFAKRLGVRRSDCQRLTQAALLHDVGKSRIPGAILNKAGPLDAAERTIMKTHAEVGHAMLIDSGFSEEMLAVVRSHHEMLDGSGYPDGLKGREIPDLVRLVTICDVYAALIERRPYKAPMGGAQAYAILEAMEGRIDAALLGAFRPLALDIGPPPMLRAG
ncbi:HD-GYP domain-containing protein [Methylobacterium sp. A54F]